MCEYVINNVVVGKQVITLAAKAPPVVGGGIGKEDSGETTDAGTDDVTVVVVGGKFRISFGFSRDLFKNNLNRLERVFHS